LNFCSIQGIYTIFSFKGEVYLYDEPETRHQKRKAPKKAVQTLSLLRTDGDVLLELPVRILHMPGLYV
jgi:hypothetical protein